LLSAEAFVELTLPEKIAILRSENSDRCECGWLIDQHPPIPKPIPLGKPSGAAKPAQHQVISISPWHRTTSRS
jgi:hypothetical protein